MKEKLYRLKEKFYRFMYGRNGVDQYSRFLIYLALILVILDIFFGGTGIFYGLGIVVMIYAYFRVFSKKLEKRRAENAKFLHAKNKIVYSFRSRRDRMKQRKDYVFFRCPSCKAMLRVPRGKGKIRVTCRKCGNAFERKT